MLTADHKLYDHDAAGEIANLLEAAFPAQPDVAYSSGAEGISRLGYTMFD